MATRTVAENMMWPEQAILAVSAPPFKHVGLDLCGHLIVKKMWVAKSTRVVHGMLKVWGVIILCLTTKAVKFNVAAGYSITVFMMSFEQFPSDHGRPTRVHSDK